MNANFVTIAFTVAIIGIGAGISVLLVAFKYPPHIRAAFNAFGYSKLVVATGFLLAAVRPEALIHPLAPVANAIIVSGLFLNYVAVRRLQQRPDYAWLTALIGFATAALATLGLQLMPHAGFEGARIVSSLFSIVILAAISFELLFRYKSLGIAHWVCGGLSLLVVVAFSIRVGWILVKFVFSEPVAWSGSPLDSPVERWLYVVIILAMVISTINFILLAADEFNKELSLLASTDSLTGAVNRRRFLEMGEAEFRRARRFEKPLTLLILDIDHFKRINDSFGHPFGDRVIQSVAKTAQECVRDGDVVARIGGEEFAVLLLETGRTSAEAMAERLRQAVGGVDLMSERGEVVAIACSIGCACLEAGHARFEDLIADADAALYAAKQAGRDRVHMAPSSGRRPAPPLLNPASGYAT